MNGLQLVLRGIKKEQKGVMKNIVKRIEKHNRVAMELGYRNAQEAYNRLGKDFLIIANK